MQTINFQRKECYVGYIVIDDKNMTTYNGQKVKFCKWHKVNVDSYKKINIFFSISALKAFNHFYKAYECYIPVENYLGEYYGIICCDKFYLTMREVNENN